MTSEEIEPNGTKLESPSPAPTVTSFKSDQSMDQLVVFKDLNRTKPEAPSPAPTVASFKSDQSMDQLVVFKDSNSKLCPDKSVSPSTSYFSMKSSQPVHKTINFHDGNVRIKLEAPSPAPTVTSFKSDQSMDQLVVFKDLNRHRTKQEAPSPAPTASFKSDQSMDQLVVDLNRVLHTRQVTKDYLRCSVCKDVLREPVATPCGHGFCKTCIQSFWNKQAQAGKYPCPQCGKKLSPALLSQSYAGPGDMACDICTGKRKRAVKWCLTCSVAYCETHVRQHYTVVALQIHELRDVTGDPETRICYLHYRALEVFCKTDQIFICLVCVMEKHKNHDTVLAKREAQDFKVFLKNDMHHGELTAKFKRTEAEFSYLTIQFYRGLEDISDYAERAALGRQMDLGMLYDCRDDSFSKDVLLWEKDVISSMTLSIPRLHKDVRILDGDSLQDRLTALDLSVSLRASVVSGLVEITGASEVINHPVQSQLQDRVTLHYRTSTRLDMLSHELLHERFLLSLNGSNTATHVVVAVLYGSQGFFVFSKNDRSTENTNLKDMVMKMIDSSSQTDLLSRLTEKEKRAVLLYDCAAFIDGDVLQRYVNFDTAVNLYNSLQDAKEVPLKVWLYSLKNLDKSMAYVVRDITEIQLCKAEKVLEHLEREINFCYHMMYVFNSHDVFTQVPALKDSLSEFSSLLQQYQSYFQKIMASCIKTTRSKGSDEFQLLLEMNANSPFSLRETYQWLKNKSTEMTALIKCISANVTVVKGQNELQSFLQDCQVDRVLCFIVTSVEGEDPFLSALKQHTESLNNVIITDKPKAFKVLDMSKKILSDLELFFFLKKGADENKQETMLIAASLPDPCLPGSAVHLFESCSLVRQNTKLEVKVEPPKIIAVQQTCVELKIQTAKYYRVEYRAVKEEIISKYMKWRVISCTGENCVVLHLTPGTHYQLRYALMDSNEVTNYSEVTEFQTAYRDRPGAPTVLKQNKDSLYIAWQKAESNEDSPVRYYMVEYLEAGLEGWQSIQTDGPVCECRISLPYSTCHRARVSAVYRNRHISTPSDEMEIPVHAWNINLSERKASLLVKLRKFQTVMKPVEITGWTDEECEMQSLLQCLLYISELSLSCDMVIKMAHDLRTIKDCGPVNLKQLSLIQRSTQQTSNTQSTRAAWLLQSSLASLLKRWKIKCLNLTESKMEAQSCIALLSYQGPLAIRFSEETLNELVVEVYEAQDEELTRCFLEKVGGEMSACCLTWGFIHYFLQHHAVTVDFRRTTIKQENIPELLPLLDRLKLTRLTSSFALSIMRKLYETGSVHIVSGLLNSTEKCINLENRQLNSVDCAALRFTLQHCTGVSLNLLWTSVPEGELQSIVSLLSHVSHLRVDRLLLLRLLHCCNIPELQKEAAVLLSALHHKLDFSCQDALDLTADTTTFNLTVEDCRVICMAILRAPENLYLNLCDCEVEEAGVMQLQTILHKVTLNCSERLLLKFDLKSAALEREKDLGPGPVDQWDWIWNIMNSCTA